MKAACVAANVERGEQAALVLSSSSDSGPSKSGAIAWSTDVMYAAIRDFTKTDFMSYLRLGELGLVNLCQICSKEEDVVLNDDAEGGE